MNEWPGWLLALVFLGMVTVATLPGVLLLWGTEWWSNRRAQRAWDHGEPERRRRWAEEDRREAVRHQLRELEEQIREEQLSDDQRAWRRRCQEREAAITQEARRRLGLPEEDPPLC